MECEDDPEFKAACSELFVPGPAADPKTKAASDRDLICLEAAFERESLWCAKTCQKCCKRPEFNCDDRIISGQDTCKEFREAPDAAARKTLCEAKRDTALEYCRKSCGYCMEGKKRGMPNPCQDRHQNCSDLVDLCDQKDHMEKVQAMCPQTCETRLGESVGICKRAQALWDFRHSPPKRDSKCGDIGKGCKQNVMICEEAPWMDEMMKKCKETCGVCVPKKYKCKDKDKRCAQWKKEGFCENFEDFPKGVIFQNCPVTCGFCPRA